MKRGIALLAVLVFLSCTAAGYLYTQRMQEPVTQEEKTEQTEPVAKEETVIGENAEIVYQYYYTEDQRTAEQVEPVQNYLLGLNLAQVRSIYDGWQVVFFSPDKVILRSTVEGRSDESFLLGEQNGMLAVFREDADGKITWDDLPLGKYYISETTSNNSLVLNKMIIDVELKYQNQTVSKVIEKKDTSNRVNMQKIQVFKSGEKDGISGLVKGLQGCEFTFKLKSEVDHVGWNNATTYAQITTNKNGIANTPYLPYGQYLVKETVTPKDYITAPDFLISVTNDYTEYEDIEQIKRVNVNNRPFTSQVKLVKVDKDSGKTVTLNSASFKIKDCNGNYVMQKIGGKKYDTFTTNSKNQITVLFGNKGEVTLPLALDAGNYTIEEVKTPQGFLALEEPVRFTITNQYDYDVDEDKDPIITIKVKNDQPKGKIILKKTDKVTADPLENVEYELTAKEDIISVIDGSILFEKGSIVAKGITDTDGKIIINDLFMGHYELKEVLTNEGYVLSEEVHDVVFEQKDLATKEYVMNFDVTNIAPKGEIHLIKTDKDSEELLSGVIYQLTAKEDIYSLDGRNALIYKAGNTVSKDISQERSSIR